MTLEWMQDKHWISIKQESISVTNHAKYHITRENEKVPPDLPDLSEPPDHKNEAPPDPPKPKKELDPTVKLWADKVYQSNPAKFRKLIVWIKECEKYNFTPTMVAMALERFFPYRDQIDQWYPYLDKLVKKAEGDINRDQHLLEHEQHKEEVRQASKILKRFNGA